MGIRNGKKVTSKNIAVIGKHNDLLKITDDPLSYAKQKVTEFNENLKKQKIDVTYSVDLSQKIINHGDIVSRSLASNIGYFYLKDIYDKLEIKQFLDNLFKNRKISFDANKINLILTCSRILDPGSKLYCFNHMHKYYGDFDFDYQHIHRFMEMLEPYFNDYITHLFEKAISSSKEILQYAILTVRTFISKRNAKMTMSMMM